MRFEIENGVLRKYAGRDARVVVPDEVHTIGGEAFSKCLDVTEIVLPKDLKRVQGYAFEHCYFLENLIFTGTDFKLDNYAFSFMTDVNIVVPFKKMRDIAEENRFFQWHRDLYQEAIKGKEPVKKFSKFCRLVGIVDENSSLKIHLRYQQSGFLEGPYDHVRFARGAIDLKTYDTGLMKFVMPYRLEVMISRLQGPYGLDPENEKRFTNYISRNIKTAVEHLLSIDDADMLRFLLTSGLIHDENAAEVLPLIKETGLPRCAALSGEVDTLLQKKKQPAKAPVKKTDTPAAKPAARRTAEQKALENVCAKNLDARKWEYDYESGVYNSISMADVCYRDSEVTAAPVVMKYLLQKYMKQFNLATQYINFQNRYIKVRIDPEADDIARKLDILTFSEKIDSLIPISYHHQAISMILPVCRFASSKYISQLIPLFDLWLSYENEPDRNGNLGRRNFIAVKGALLLSDTLEAMLFADQNGLLDVYAGMRDEEEAAMRKLLLREYKADKDDAAMKNFLESKGLLRGRTADELIREMKAASLPRYQRLQFGEGAPGYTEALKRKKAVAAPAKGSAFTPEQTAVEAECALKYQAFKSDKALKDAGIKEKDLGRVVYAGSSAFASALVVKHILSQYIIQVDKLPTSYGDYKTDKIKVALSPSADAAAEALDKASLQATLDAAIDIEQAFMKPRVILPYCRYASGGQIKKLLAAMNHWQLWSEFGARGRVAIILAHGALMLSETPEAILFIEKKGWMAEYARIHNTTETSVRDRLAEGFGFDKNGAIAYDIGGNTVIASLDDELRFSLLDKASGKSARSFPKTSNNPGKLAQSEKEFKALNQAVSLYIRNQVKNLREEYVNGTSHAAKTWLEGLKSNMVRKRLVSLFVWQYQNAGERLLFIMTASGPVDVNGNPVNLKPSGTISLAHPMEMKKNEVLAWRKSFDQNQVKQPFEQVWEPIYKIEGNETRYRNAEAPLGDLLALEEIGFTVEDRDGYYSLSNQAFFISLDFSEVDPFPRVYTYKSLSPSAIMKLMDLTYRIPKSEKMINMVLVQLDLIVCRQKIEADNASLDSWLPAFTEKQIQDLLLLAKKKKSQACLAVLEEYQEKVGHAMPER